MQTDVKLLFLAGSARVASLNKRLVRAAAAVADTRGLSATVVDLADYTMPIYDGDVEVIDGVPESARALAILLAGHHGVFIASPEYNASISPLLKNTLDWISRLRGSELDGLAILKSRVFALGSASPGGTGGMRGLVAVRYTLEMGLGALVLPDQVLVPRANAAFADDGSLVDPEARTRLDAVIARLALVASRVHG
jgi:NAD(P)H-dependent FMN reductase